MWPWIISRRQLPGTPARNEDAAGYGNMPRLTIANLCYGIACVPTQLNSFDTPEPIHDETLEDHDEMGTK